MLNLPVDPKKVFTSPQEFSTHHGQKQAPKILPFGFLFSDSVELIEK